MNRQKPTTRPERTNRAHHTCTRCGATTTTTIDHSAHDRMLSHVAIVHHFYRPRECTATTCRFVTASQTEEQSQ